MVMCGDIKMNPPRSPSLCLELSLLNFTVYVVDGVGHLSACIAFSQLLVIFYLVHPPVAAALVMPPLNDIKCAF